VTDADRFKLLFGPSATPQAIQPRRRRLDDLFTATVQATEESVVVRTSARPRGCSGEWRQ
jgi:hypothetical protein